MLQRKNQLPLAFDLAEAPSFANFYCRPDNAVALHAVQNMLQPAGEQQIYLWGASGSGCSYLLQACHHAARAQGWSSTYVQLTENSEPKAWAAWDNLQLLCIEGVACIGQHAALEQALFQRYEVGRSRGVRWLVGATQPPGQLPIDLPDLRSRLGWGPVFTLASLTDDEKLKVLSQCAKRLGFTLPNHVGQYLLRHHCRDMGALKSALMRLERASMVMQQPITIPLLKAALSPSTQIPV